MSCQQEHGLLTLIAILVTLLVLRAQKAKECDTTRNLV